MSGVVRISVKDHIDVVTAYLRGSTLAAKLGFSVREIHSLALAIAEVARNIVRYAGKGEVTIAEARQGQHRGVVVVARDEGPGIADVDQALQEGYSTGRSLGMGLPAVAEAMDEFRIDSAPGKGTTVTMILWKAPKPKR